MKNTKLMTNLSRSLSRVGLKFKKHSPEIMVVGGVVGVVTSAVMACKATTKIDEVLAESKETIEKAKTYVYENGYSEKYTEKDYKKDLTICYGKSVISLVKLYGPSVILGAVSITSILAGHNILRKRNVAIAAAYSAIDRSFKDYRGRVVERFGEELDKELKYNIKAKEIEEVKKDEETGKEKVEKAIVQVADPNGYSDYARFFDDVYEMLGIPRTKAGQVVGWIYDEKHPVGDNFVDFGIYDIYNERARDFVNGYERTILLDFNVDGNILDMI